MKSYFLVFFGQGWQQSKFDEGSIGTVTEMNEKCGL